MADVKFTWNGDEVKLRAEKAASLSSFEVGLVVEGQAKLLAPVDSGRLRASITTVSGTNQRTTPKGKGAVASDVIRKPNDAKETFVGTPVNYGPYMEYGTVKTDAQPFLRPALDIVKGRQPAIISIINGQGKIQKVFGDYIHPSSMRGTGV